jgi:excisionase family DNA binding protein
VQTSTETSVADLPTVRLADLLDGPVTIPVWHATEPSLCAVLRCSRAHGYRLARAGEVPTVRMGGSVRIPVHALVRDVLGVEQ